MPATKKLVGPNVDHPSVIGFFRGNTVTPTTPTASATPSLSSVPGFFRTNVVAPTTPMAATTPAALQKPQLTVTPNQEVKSMPVATTPQSQTAPVHAVVKSKIRIKTPTLYSVEFATQFPWSRRMKMISSWKV